MKLDHALRSLGLVESEPQVYLELLKLPGAQPASVIAAHANLNRTTVYKTLVRLARRGLVTKTQRHGITCFFAENPERRLRLLIEERQKQLLHTNRTVLEALPLLISGENERQDMPRIRYYEGFEGIKQMYEVVLKEKEDLYCYGDIDQFYDVLGDYADEYIRKRNEEGITTHAIMPLKDGDDPQRRKHAQERREVLYIPQKLFPIEGEVRIFDNKVAILSLRKESPLGVIIDSHTIAKMFKSIFMLTWKNHGAEGVRLSTKMKKGKAN